MGFRDYDPGLNRFTTRDMYNGALADMGLGTDPYTANRYAFTGGNPINRVEIDGHDSWFTDVLEKGEETVAKAATAAAESQASRSIWDTAKTAGKRNLVGAAISTVIDIWNGDDPLHALACSAGCRQMKTRSLTDRIRCSSQPREEPAHERERYRGDSPYVSQRPQASELAQHRRCVHSAGVPRR
ncbi:hypothetical protein AB0D27_42785 [Streptomyces sp. NPDC048415]|uniref:hypothetical protein n=1 Tax=Streptomyces sp. NPDC048415 TaxID=3154822 RepID=UPI003425471D